jgi:hypothetical protein
MRTSSARRGRSHVLTRSTPSRPTAPRPVAIWPWSLGTLAILALAGAWWLVAEIRAAMGPVGGKVMLAFFNHAPPEVRLVALVFEGRERLTSPVEPEGWRIWRERHPGPGVVTLLHAPWRHRKRRRGFCG